MRAAVCRSYGPPDVVHVEELPSPSVGAGEVRIRVHAAVVNFPDVLLVANQYQVSVPTPFVPGSEFAGVVEAVKRVPADVDERVAAAFGVAHSTAFHVLRSVARLRPGEKLVVLGAGGGVGLAAVHLGTILGAAVTAVASSAEKLEVAASFGARTLINHRSVDLRQALREAHPDGVDVVVDPAGGDLAEPALRALRWGGRFVTVGYASGSIPRIPLNLVLLKGIQIVGFQFRDFAVHMSDEFHRNEEDLLELLASHRVAPYIGASFGLEDVVKALQFVANGRAIGKVVLDVNGRRTT